MMLLPRVTFRRAECPTGEHRSHSVAKVKGVDVACIYIDRDYQCTWRSRNPGRLLHVHTTERVCVSDARAQVREWQCVIHFAIELWVTSRRVLRNRDVLDLVTNWDFQPPLDVRVPSMSKKELDAPWRIDHGGQ